MCAHALFAHSKMYVLYWIQSKLPFQNKIDHENLQMFEKLAQNKNEKSISVCSTENVAQFCRNRRNLPNNEFACENKRTLVQLDFADADNAIDAVAIYAPVA